MNWRAAERMKRVERTHKWQSNLMTGIAAADKPSEAAALGRIWWAIPLKTCYLGRQSRGTNGCGTRRTLGAV